MFAQIARSFVGIPFEIDDPIIVLRLKASNVAVQRRAAFGASVATACYAPVEMAMELADTS